MGVVRTLSVVAAGAGRMVENLFVAVAFVDMVIAGSLLVEIEGSLFVVVGRKV